MIGEKLKKAFGESLKARRRNNEKLWVYVYMQNRIIFGIEKDAK